MATSRGVSCSGSTDKTVQSHWASPTRSRHDPHIRAAFGGKMHQNAMFLGPRLSISEFKRRQACNPTQPIFAALKVKIISKRIFQLGDTLRKHTSTMIRISKYRKYNKYNGVMIRGASTGDLHNAGHRCTSDYLVLDPWWAGVCPDKTISMHLVPDRSCESYQYNPQIHIISTNQFQHLNGSPSE